MIICFDIGGTAIKGALARSAEEIRPVPRLATPAGDYPAFVAALKSVVDQADETVTGLSLSIAGVIDPETGLATIANIPCLHGRALRHDLERDIGLPVVIANDADCFALAEAGMGAGRGHKIVFGIILGTGVGGGVVSNGRLINEDGGFAGEWGHAPAVACEGGTPPVRIPRYACGCGQTGCIDTVGSARGMERIHQHMTGEAVDSVEITARWIAGEPVASRTIDVYVDLLASPLALCINMTGATIVPAGGGLANCLPLLDALDKAVRMRILRRLNRKLVVPAECAMEPGLIGAALNGFQHVG